MRTDEHVQEELAGVNESGVKGDIVTACIDPGQSAYVHADRDRGLGIPYLSRVISGPARLSLRTFSILVRLTISFSSRFSPVQPARPQTHHRMMISHSTVERTSIGNRVVK